jgi:CheY-like chemotaxis protein
MENAFVPRPDLIFLDLNMPRVSGMEILTVLKSTALYADVPAIIHSTSTAQKDREKAKQLGAVYYLPKPNNFTTLCESLRELFLYFEIPVGTVH